MDKGEVKGTQVGGQHQEHFGLLPPCQLSLVAPTACTGPFSCRPSGLQQPLQPTNNLCRRIFTSKAVWDAMTVGQYLVAIGSINTDTHALR